LEKSPSKEMMPAVSLLYQRAGGYPVRNKSRPWLAKLPERAERPQSNHERTQQ
jgi:hypothetical protein